MTGEILHIDYSIYNQETSNCLVCGELSSIFRKSVKLVYNVILSLVRLCLSIIYGKGEQMPSISDVIIMESVTSLAGKVRTGQLKSVDIVKAFITRIKEINPMLNCVIEDRFQDALIDACHADALVESGKFSEDELANQFPFLGIPFTTKDSIQVKNMLNTAGLWLRKNYRSDEDAKCIKLLREAGAIPLAITNVPELCMWWESNNKIFGRTNNPYDTSRIAGGSSGGEGCIQAAAGSAFGLGSDIGGSIRMPAFFNGIFGHKPSKYTVSNHGQFPPVLGDEQDSFLSIGPMCRYATDLRPILKVIAAEKSEILNLDEPVDLKNVKFFYQLDDGGSVLVQPVEKAIRHTLYRVVKHIENKFGQSSKRVQLEKFSESADIWCANMKDSSGKCSEHQLANLEGRINPYIQFGKCLIGSSKHTIIAIVSAIVERFQVQYGTSAYMEYVEKRNELLQEVQDLLGDNGVLLYPTHPTVAPYHWEPFARSFNFSYTAIFNCLGLPSTAVPLGIGTEGLPLGIQVVANHNQDRLCLAVAEELEKAFGGWVAPAIEV